MIKKKHRKDCSMNHALEMNIVLKLNDITLDNTIGIFNFRTKV